MTGPEHYHKAEQCIGWAVTETDRDKRASLHAQGQMHAVLAQTAMDAFALGVKAGAVNIDRLEEWLKAIGVFQTGEVAS